MRFICPLILLFSICLAACSTVSSQTPALATDMVISTSPVAATIPQAAPAVETRMAQPTASAIPEPEEAVLILEPGPGSRVASPIHIEGMADSTFEQNLVVEILNADGTQLAVSPVTIQAELGQRGPFAIDIPVQASSEQPLFVQVSASSPRDGGITHLASVVVSIVENGQVDIKRMEPRAEQIQILSPAVGQTLKGGVAVVEGYGWASFEQTLVVELYDEQGTLLTMQPIIVQSPEMGQPGLFRAELAYTINTPGAGRIVVRDPSVAFAGDVHVTSVEVRLEP